jgi:hypothetical protein
MEENRMSASVVFRSRRPKVFRGGVHTQIIAEHIDTRPLIHHERTHAKQNTLEVAGLVVVAKHFTPSRLSELIFDANVIENLIELAFDFGIFIALVEESCNDMASLVDAAMFGEPSRCFAEEGTAAEA